MEGENAMAPLLYKIDLENNKAIPQTEVGHFLCANGPNWSPDGSKFYFVCS
jgi:sugar lactone lactonase YvrE